MAVMECIECGGLVFGADTACPHCGSPLRVSAAGKPAAPARRRLGLPLLLGALGVAVLVVLALLLSASHFLG